MPKIDGGEILVRGLRAEGVRILFGLPDVSYSPVFRSAEDAGLRIVGGRHESANVHMADGWARATGEVAAVLGALGPGVANMVPGVVTAWIEGVPMLVIATQRTERVHRAVRRGPFQHTPQLDLFRPVTKLATVVPDARRIPEFVREAFRVALTGRPGPVYLEIADEIFRQKVDEERIPSQTPGAYRVQPGPPDPVAVRDAAELLANAKYPVVVAGDGVQRAQATEELGQLVERLGALVMTSMGSRGSVAEDDGPVVLPASEAGKAAAQQADVVLAVGTQVGELLGFGRPPRWAEGDAQRWIQLDADPLVIGVNRPVDVALVGDARAGLSALLAALGERPPGFEPPAGVRDTLRAFRAERARFVETLLATPSTPIHPGRSALEVASFFPPNAIACFDGGNTTVWAHLAHQFRRPRSLLWTSHFGHLGTGLPYAIAAKLAHPARPVYLFTGDGAFGFNLQELETAARAQANVVVVINCDYAWSMEHLGQVVEIGRTIGVSTSRVRYDEVARGLGCHGDHVSRVEDLRPALERAQRADKPAVVQVEIDAEANVEPPGLLDLAQMYAASEGIKDLNATTALGYAKFRLGKAVKKVTGG